MSADRAIAILWLVGGLVLVGSGLVARRMPRGRWIGMALTWAAIFALLFGMARWMDGRG